ncbi:hypothetical protein [Methylobacterium brachythecii]|uniref:Uncharacterized protein n=1 Tax=Methylobacterium brachythecii TaxID=1176177 RepID=A0A7W6ARE9_9HYPH|nr:hypothetical protein [Methylobacterium brachythecii]MBB3905311.1 hypothetical protein [Methylobacterium brachythecii]
MSVQRWALVPDDPAKPVRVFTAREAAIAASRWCPGRVSPACDEDALAERCRSPVPAGRRP